MPRKKAKRPRSRNEPRATAAVLDPAHVHPSAIRDLSRLRVIAASALACGLLFSPRLWVSVGRLYPTAPVADALPSLPGALEGVLYAALLGALVVATLRRWDPRPVVLALTAVAVFVLWDQSRLQPWVYLFAALLAISCRAARTDGGRNDALLMTARCVLVATYFWSGLQKANVNFVTGTWPEVAAPLLAALPPGLAEVVHHGGVLIPLTECAIAGALLVPRLRRAAVVGAIATHATILALLLAAGENSVVWAWNAAMPLLAVVLFWRAPARPREILLADRSARHTAFAVAFGLLPALSLAGCWDAYLSAALYSGNTAQAVVLVDPDRFERLPPTVRASTWRESLPMFIDLNRWSFDELNVPAYPAPRVLRHVGREVCSRYGRAGAQALVVLQAPDWRHGDRARESYDCGAPTRLAAVTR